MNSEIKMVNDEWLCKITESKVDYYGMQRELYDIDFRLKKMEELIDDRGMEGIGYSSIYQVIDEVNSKSKTLTDFVTDLPDYMSMVDSKFCKLIQNGSVNTLSKIKVENFITTKIGKLETSGIDHGNINKSVTYNYKFEDFIGIVGNENEYEEDYARSSGKINDSYVREFADMYKKQYEEGKDSEDSKSFYKFLNGEMTAGEFVQKRQHDIMNSPIAKIISMVLDFVPVVGIVKLTSEAWYEMVTGKEAYTGDELTFEESRNASLFSLGSVLLTPIAGASISTKYFEGAMVDIDSGIASGTIKDLTKETIKFTDDYTESMIKHMTKVELDSVEDVIEGSSYSSFADLMSLEDAAKYNKFLSEGSIEGLTDIEINAFSKVDGQLALSKVDYDEVLKLRREIASKKSLERIDNVVEDVIEGSKSSLGIDELMTKDSKFLNSKGDIDWEKWAPNGGRVPGTIKEEQVLDIGTVIDRYGNQYGKYTSPVGVPYEQRALPYIENPNAYHQYEVIKPINNVTFSEIAKAFEQPGGGIQYELPSSIKQLIKEGFIKEIK